MRIAMSMLGLLFMGYVLAHPAHASQEQRVAQAAQSNVVDAMRVLQETVKPAIQAATRVSYLATVA